MLELYVPKTEDMWFRQKMQADPATMAYNAGWDVGFSGYHPDTGCIDLPEREWEEECAWLTGHEPERFYAYVREKETGALIGEVNYHYTRSENWYDMGIVLYAPYRGKGYSLAALELLLHRAFVVNGITRLHNDFEESRSAALTIHKQAGFRETGRSEIVRFGKVVALVDLELRREDYLADLENENREKI